MGEPLQPGPDETLDAVGPVRLLQKKEGYRFSVDAPLLADFAGRPRGRTADLGTGSGVVALLLAARGAPEVVAVELQGSLFDLATRNVALNGLTARVRVVQADLRKPKGTLPAGTFDLVVSNPPYVAAQAGHLNPAQEKAVARHELTSSLPELCQSARYLLRDGGSLKVVFPAPRLIDLLVAAKGAGLEPKRLRMVHPVAHRPAKLVLLECVRGGRSDLEVMPPLVIHEGPGYTPEAREILGLPQGPEPTGLPEGQEPQ